MDLESIIKEFDARMCYIKKIVEDLEQKVTGTRQEIPLINLTITHERADNISILRYFNGELNTLVNQVVAVGRAADAIHTEEIRIVRNGISRAALTASSKPSPDNLRDRTENASYRADNVSSQDADSADNARDQWMQKIAIPGPKPKMVINLDQTQMISVAPNVKVPAFVVPSHLRGKDLRDAVQPGKLYYIPQWNHFAVNIAGAFMHAGVGSIYRGRVDTPSLIKDCWKAKCSRTDCRYYHDPEFFPGSTDVRNYITDSWYYVPAFITIERTGARRIGDAENLETDLKTITAQDARRFVSGVMHDLICAILVHNAVIEKN